MHAFNFVNAKGKETLRNTGEVERKKLGEQTLNEQDVRMRTAFIWFRILSTSEILS
jgi:hypothetical protein